MTFSAKKEISVKKYTGGNFYLSQQSMPMIGVLYGDP